MQIYRFIVSGKVQGVFYRKFVSQEMMKEQFQGYVKNLKDGTVEMVAAVYDDDFDRVMQILRNGSPASSVENVSYKSIEDADFVTDGFEIRY
ncbi:MAG: acylphosphatase [Sulfurovum sp.]|nr:acylphosphatase [Sulfurovum sp.]MDD3603075.1 acylphosphatase [Sulfurovum sp.]